MTSRNSQGFRTVVAYEAKRTWRSLLPFCIIAASIIVYLFAPALREGNYDGLGFQSPSLSRQGDLAQVIPLLGVLLGAYSAWETQRDLRTQTEEIMLGWPVQAWKRSLARSISLGSVTAAVFLSLAIPSAIHAAVSYATAVGSSGSWVVYAMKDTGIISVDLVASLLGSQAIGQVAGSALSGISAIVLVILYRLAALVGPGIIMGTMQWPYSLLASPDLVAWNYWVPYSEAFGLVPHEELFFTHRFFWLTAGLCAIAALSILSSYRRDAQGKLPRLVLGATVLLAIASAVPFITHENRRMEAQQDALAAFGQPIKPRLVVREDGHVDTGKAVSFEEDAGQVVPLGYTIVADFSSPPTARISVTLTLKPEASLSELDFTLRRIFKVDRVGLNGHPVPAGNLRREGDILVIASDRAFKIGELITVTITYSGKVEDWRLDPYERPVAIARRGMLVVPATWGWYPVPGRHALTWEIPMTSLVYRYLEDRARPFGESEPLFDVTLIPPQEISAVAGFAPRSESVGLVGTNARDETIWKFSGRRQQVSLLGGNWAIYKQEGIEYLVPVQYIDTWESCSKSFRQLLNAATDWLGLDSAIVVQYSIADPQFVDAGLFGPIYHAGPDGTTLYRALNRWIRKTHLFGLMYSEPGSVDAEYQHLFSSDVVDYVLSQIRGQSGVERAVYPSDGHDGEEPVNELGQRFQEWTRKTPVQEQKQVLRRLFAAARRRPLLAEDFQFLHRGGK